MHIKMAMSTLILAMLVFFERMPAAGFAEIHPVKVGSLRDLHLAESLCVPSLVPLRKTRPRRYVHRFDFRVWGELTNQQYRC